MHQMCIAAMQGFWRILLQPTFQVQESVFYEMTQFVSQTRQIRESIGIAGTAPRGQLGRHSQRQPAFYRRGFLDHAHRCAMA